MRSPIPLECGYPFVSEGTIFNKEILYMNSQITFHRRPALAALLMVLSASTVLAQANDVPFKGAYAGHEADVVQGGSLLVDGSGAGTASHVGRFT